MKMICPHCEGSGIVDHMIVKTDGESTFYKCELCNRIANYEFVCDCINSSTNKHGRQKMHAPRSRRV